MGELLRGCGIVFLAFIFLVVLVLTLAITTGKKTPEQREQTEQDWPEEDFRIIEAREFITTNKVYIALFYQINNGSTETIRFAPSHVILKSLAGSHYINQVGQNLFALNYGLQYSLESMEIEPGKSLQFVTIFSNNAISACYKNDCDFL
jgi:hypothetical protein